MMGFQFQTRMSNHAAWIFYCLDKGTQMEMTFSQGCVLKEYSNNTVIGSLMCGGGSSGGPFISNFGKRPKLASDLPSGNFSTSTVVVGVDSWGYVDLAYKTIGAIFSPLIIFKRLWKRFAENPILDAKKNHLDLEAWV
jgi:hypothetical protein